MIAGVGVGCELGGLRGGRRLDDDRRVCGLCKQATRGVRSGRWASRPLTPSLGDTLGHLVARPGSEVLRRAPRAGRGCQDLRPTRPSSAASALGPPRLLSHHSRRRGQPSAPALPPASTFTPQPSRRHHKHSRTVSVPSCLTRQGDTFRARSGPAPRARPGRRAHSPLSSDCSCASRSSGDT